VGIGARITAIFVLGALLLSFSLGGLSYFTTRHFLLAERESAAQNQAFANALVVQSALASKTTPHTQYAALLASLDVGSGSNSILFRRSVPYPSSLSISKSTIPRELLSDVFDGSVATQTLASGSQNQPQIIVGVPIPSVHAAYFEVFSLSDLGHTLRVLGITLVSTALLTTLLGAALGRFASRRLLRPLAGVSRAAVAIAGGQLDTRLEPDAADPDLEGLTSSFNTMVDQLQARIEREARFNSDVSHELRSPLTTLSASLEVLEADREELPQRAQRALQLLGDDLRRFQRMVAVLLDMSRADAGSVDVFLEEVNASELVQRAVEAGMRTLGEGTPTPVVAIAPEAQSLHVGVDKRRFERIMTNLLENAANYGGGATVISVAAVRPTPVAVPVSARRSTPNAAPPALAAITAVEIAVEDAGPGINPTEALKIFERFYRGSASGRRGAGTGTGLGLALVAEHVRIMRGEVRVESSPSGGARFVVTLPLFDDEDDASTW
jgi:two-component system sensor histidine kinase MtrB